MDTDTMRRPGSHGDALDLFREGRAHILLGTQMIAKGLDFPDVTLVGVINADTALHIPDFRAAERTFQLVTQVAGRTGRGPKGGRVLVQTYSPEHPAILAASRHNYTSFAQGDLSCREQPLPGYPPFSSMVRLVVRGEEERAAEALAHELGERLTKSSRQLDGAIRLLGPAPAPIAKLRGCFRFHMLLQAARVDLLQNAVKQATVGLQTTAGTAWIVDVDPIDML
jgi:primosomal protein N' (replication factor Y)